VLFAQADRLRSLTPSRSGGRRGPGAYAGAAAKVEARRRIAQNLAAHAVRLRAMDRDALALAGPTVDAAVAGYLLAWCAGAEEMWRELDLELLEQYGRSPLPSLDRHDLSGVCQAVADACRE
jgi:hypothetical protein